MHLIPRNRARAAALALAVLVPLAACGGDDGEDATSDTTTAGSGAEGTAGGAGESGPVEVTHRYGTTEVAERPERIVSLDSQWTDALIALGAPPVGYIPDPNVEAGLFPWQEEGLAGATAMPATDVLPYEQIAGLEPDLIVVTYLAQDQDDYDRLSEIAPTIATLTDRQVDTWQDITATVGDVLGEPQAADDLVAEVEAGVASLGEELPGLEGKTFLLANFVAGDAIYVVSDPEDGANVVFQDLGMELFDTVLEAGAGTPGRAELSLEQSDLLDSDLLILFTNGADPEEIVGYDSLPAVESDAVAVLDYADVVGLNTPSPLSLPLSLEVVRPALEAAAAT